MLGRGIDHDVGAERERALPDRGGKHVVDDQPCAGGMRDLGDGGNVEHVERRVGRALQEERPGVRLHRALPFVELEAVDQRRLDAVAGQEVLHHIAAASEQLLGGHHMVAGLERCQDRGGHRGHPGRRRAAGFGALELDHAALEHRNGRVGVARIDVAGVLALEARLAQLRAVVDIALGQEQPLRRLAEFGAERAAMDQAGLGAKTGGGRGGGRFGHVTSVMTAKSGHKKTGLGNSSRPGSHASPACLAIYLTWLQAGRLKSPRDKSCSYSQAAFPSRRGSAKAVKGLNLRDYGGQRDC